MNDPREIRRAKLEIKIILIAAAVILSLVIITAFTSCSVIENLGGSVEAVDKRLANLIERDMPKDSIIYSAQFPYGIDNYKTKLRTGDSELNGEAVIKKYIYKQDTIYYLEVVVPK